MNWFRFCTNLREDNSQKLFARTSVPGRVRGTLFKSFRIHFCSCLEGHLWRTTWKQDWNPEFFVFLLSVWDMLKTNILKPCVVYLMAAVRGPLTVKLCLHSAIFAEAPPFSSPVLPRIISYASLYIRRPWTRPNIEKGGSVSYVKGWRVV